MKKGLHRDKLLHVEKKINRTTISLFYLTLRLLNLPRAIVVVVVDVVLGSGFEKII
jgi:hypothetical protein